MIIGGGKLDDLNKLQLYSCVLSFFLFTNTQPFMSIGLIYCVENMTIHVLDALQRLAPTSIERMRSRYDKMPIFRAYSYQFPSPFIKTAAATHGAFLVSSASFHVRKERMRYHSDVAALVATVKRRQSKESHDPYHRIDGLVLDRVRLLHSHPESRTPDTGPRLVLSQRIHHGYRMSWRRDAFRIHWAQKR